jgi:RND family efflux transporter MFP subunit
VSDRDLESLDEGAGPFFFIGWVAAVVVVLAAMGGLVLARELWIRRQSAELTGQFARGPRVLVTPVTHGGGKRTINLPGDIHGVLEAPVYAKVSGYLKQINVDKGDRVAQGDLIAVLEAPELDQQFANAKAAYEIKVVTDRRMQSLVKRGVVAKQEADQSNSDLQQAKATLQQLAALKDYEQIRAPFDGIITARNADPGTLVSQGTGGDKNSMPLVEVAKLDTLRVYVQLPQNAAPFVKDGNPAVISIAEYANRKFEGVVTRHPEALTASTRTMIAEIDIENPDRSLYPGMYAQVGIQIVQPAGAPTVPDDALIFRNGKTFVPIVRADRLHLALVSLGFDNGQTVEVTDGLSGDEMVAMNVGQTAREGEPVQPVRMAEQ